MAGISRERRLAYATGHEHYLFHTAEIRERLAQRPPYRQAAARTQLAESPSHLTDYQIDDVDTPGMVLSIDEDVIESERPAQERVVALRQTEHHELAWPNPASNFRAFQTQAIRSLSERFLEEHTGTAEMGHD
jgi:hypothetical protein